MIPIKKYKKCVTTKDGRIIEYISVNDLRDIFRQFEIELIKEFINNDYTEKGLHNKFNKLMKI